MFANREPKIETRKRTAVQIDFSECEGLTEQHHKDECDIKNIVRKYEKIGIGAEMFMYGENDCMDLTDAPTYLEYQQKLADANSLFESLPARVRARCENSPAQFLEFMQDDRNIDEIEKMGFDASYLRKPIESPSGDKKSDPVPQDKKTNKTQSDKTGEE
ncbi:internal scaffolding protein [Microviridae sp.]|nr:internal scaffolding protein [Microviridae sp.]